MTGTQSVVVSGCQTVAQPPNMANIAVEPELCVEPAVSAVSISWPSFAYSYRLSDDAAMFFISLVEHSPALWDMTLPEYSNNAVKSALWRHVANEMHDRYPEWGPYVPEALKTFFNNKRRTYRQEKKKLGTSRNGQASGDFYAGKWKYFHCLTFLDAAKPAGTRTYSEAFEAAEPETPPEQDTEQDSEQDDADCEETSQQSRAAVNMATSAGASRSRKAKGSHHSPIDDWATRTAAFEKISNAAVQQTSETDDAAALFGKAVAALIRPLSPLKLVRCLGEILRVVEKYLAE